MPVLDSEINKNRSNGIRMQNKNQQPAVPQNAAKSTNNRRRRRRPAASNENKENMNSNENSAPVSSDKSTKNNRRRGKRRPAAASSENRETNPDLTTENSKPKNNRRRGGKNKTKYLYEFKCACGQTWINSTSRGECRKCKIVVEPHNKYEKKPGLTPYQGTGRTYGYFKCSECDKSWTSAYSWANYGQECKDCLINIYPFQQRPFIRQNRRGSDKGTKKPHPQELCGKCTADRSSCTLIE